LTQRRFPHSVFSHGAEPDARFSLANERTFLAWVRTALALIAAGVALEAFELPIEPTFRVTAAIVLISLGALSPIQAWLGWMNTERALRLDKLLPAPHLAGPIGFGVVAAALLIVTGLLIG